MSVKPIIFIKICLLKYATNVFIKDIFFNGIKMLKNTKKVVFLRWVSNSMTKLLPPFFIDPKEIPTHLQHGLASPDFSNIFGSHY